MVKVEEGSYCPGKKIEGGEIIGLISDDSSPEKKEETTTPKKRGTKKVTTNDK